ncbi:hypothetical protein [Azospirillum sp. B2RO_4]|uniref:hypothetical protein n=1 Tax=Azospirillum sp. B2RO_4 TaxID=3027796 RepID=UPI003DA8024A
MTYMHAGRIFINGIASPNHDTEMVVPIVTLTFLDKGGMQIDLTPDGARSMARRLAGAADAAEEECGA